MATTFSSYMEAPVSQQANYLDSSPQVLPRKRSPSDLYYSSYGESEGTPTPKTSKVRHSYSRLGFSSDPSSPNFYSTPPSAQVPRESTIEDSGDESDDVYDQFDLGDFTKEEIKRYECMVGPGERLRDAASPETFAEMREAAYQRSFSSSSKQAKASTSARSLPEELYDLVSAGVSNAIQRLISQDYLRHTNLDETEETVESWFMEEITKPTPQLSRFIREHDFVRISSSSIRDEQRQYEQAVYDFARKLGLSMQEANQWVLTARESWSKKDYNNEESGGVDISDETSYQLYDSPILEPSMPLPPVGDLDNATLTPIPAGGYTRSSQQFRGTSTVDAPPARRSPDEPRIAGEDETEEVGQLLARSKSKGAKQVQRYIQSLKDIDPHFAYDSVMSRLQFLDGEPLIDNVAGLREEIDKMEATGKTKEGKAARNKAKKAARKDAKQATMAVPEAQNVASRPIAKNKSRESDPHQAERSEEQEPLTSHLEPKRRGENRKRKHELSALCEVPSEAYHKHKKGRVDRDALDANSKKGKKKQDTGPQHSPFFQRSNDSKAKKKDAVKKAEQLMSFQSPMIQSPPADTPSTPATKRAPLTVSPPLSHGSSPLSSLRSTPSLLSFGKKEIESDNKRIVQISRNLARSKSVALSQKLHHNPTDLPTPVSSPISLLDLNRRLLEGTIYQDGIVLAKPGAPVTLSVSKKPRKRSVTASPFFSKSPSKKPKARDKVSCIPFPPLRSTSFGLVQERLCHDPFRLLIAVIFLNKTRGSVALPVFYELMDRYPTPADLAAANQDDIVDIIQHLGLQNQRAKKCINLAKAWLERPPEKGKRYRVLHYPKKDDGKDVRPDDVLNEEDERVAWEIGQLPGIGAYAIDSWRIFCRDELRGLPTGLPKELTPEAKEEELQKEWTRVLAGDKELRAYLRWRWLRNGWDWDPLTGERKKAAEIELAKADKGGVIYEGDGGDMVVGDAKCEGLEGVEAELEVREENGGNESGEVENAVAESKVIDALEKEDEDADGTTACPQYLDGIGKEQGDGKAVKDEPHSGNRV